MSSVDPNANQAKVYIWETKVGDEDGIGTTVGHASIELRGRGAGRYFSFRPKNSAWVNPLLFWKPTAGESVTSVRNDELHEGKQPDRTITVKLNDEQMRAAAKKVDQLNNEAKERKLLYTLFPKLSVVRPVQLLATKTGHEELSRCPFSGQKMGDNRHEDFKGLLEVKSGHCASTVHEILESAEGIELPPHSLAPWLVTPSTLGNQVEKLSRESK